MAETVYCAPAVTAIFQLSFRASLTALTTEMCLFSNPRWFTVRGQAPEAFVPNQSRLLNVGTVVGVTMPH